MSNQTCSACGTQVASYDGVLLSAKEGTRFLCSRCYNETIAEYLGLDYEHVAFEPVTIEDLDGIPGLDPVAGGTCNSTIVNNGAGTACILDCDPGYEKNGSQCGPVMCSD